MLELCSNAQVGRFGKVLETATRRWSRGGEFVQARAVRGVHLAARAITLTEENRHHGQQTNAAGK
jgi:hypothetical protein